ncbi:MAG: LytTR family DNA-binding domain-containing protein [Oscillospiraceae bacterium]|nr:LytTR family DNA-binding domain-containing protein [Oscillospiraceae bacterium]
MINIAICEDNFKQRDYIYTIIENYIMRENLNMKIALSTDRSADILDFAKNHEERAIYFLDIHLVNDIGGVELGRYVRTIDPSAFIIFVTTFSEVSNLVFEYRVCAMDYILKDDKTKMKTRIEDCLKEASDLYFNESRFNRIITVKTSHKILNLRVEDILFLETSEKAHKIRVHEMNSQKEFYATLKEIESQLGNDFYRCHKSFIVNVRKIKEINKTLGCAIMANGEQCYISNKYFKGLVECLQKNT